MIISCPKCARKLIVKSERLGHLLGCPFCQAKFAAPGIPRRKRPSGWQSFLSGFLLPFSILAKFAKMCWTGLTSAAKKAAKDGSIAPHFRPSPHVNGRTGSELFFERDEDDDDYYYYDDDIDYGDEPAMESSEVSRSRSYYDSHGTFVGYRDEEGWVHAEGGRNYIGRIDDDGTFYDSSGMYRGQIDSHDGSGYMWEDREGYTGFQDGNRFSSEGNIGIPDIYEDGGEGTGGAFHALLDDKDDDEFYD